MATTPERFIWAAELVAPEPADHVLEIGCGMGLLAEQLSNQLVDGKLFAIDKSSAMLEKAKKRNKEYIEKGISHFICSDFSKADLPKNYFNSIVAFNANFFWNDPRNELRIIQQSLKRDGKLFVFYQSPFEIDISAVEPIKKGLTENTYRIIDIQLKKMLPASSFCIVAKAICN